MIEVHPPRLLVRAACLLIAAAAAASSAAAIAAAAWSGPGWYVVYGGLDVFGIYSGPYTDEYQCRVDAQSANERATRVSGNHWFACGHEDTQIRSLTDQEIHQILG